MGWIDDLRPASFRGVAFLYDSHQRTGGRRAVLHEFPMREAGSGEDLGRKSPTFRLAAYVLAPPNGSVQDLRNAFQAALDAPGSGTLVHPWLGSVTVICASATLTESGEKGGEAAWELEFIPAGAVPSPTSTQDTAAGLLSGLNVWLQRALTAYAIGSLIVAHPGILLGLAEGALGNLAAQFTGLSPSILAQIGGLVTNLAASAQVSGVVLPVTSGITGCTGDPVAVAVTDIFASAATAVVAQAAAAETTDAPMPADPSAGLAALATWTPPASTQTGLAAPAQAALAQSLTALVQGAATYAVALAYAGLDWTTANAAAAARIQLLALLDAQVQLAASMEDDASVSAWLTLTGLVMTDLTARVQALPQVVPYRTMLSLPAPVLAQLLYGDGSRADQLAAYNGAIHPGAMPLTGVALAA